jgi:integrase
MRGSANDAMEHPANNPKGNSKVGFLQPEPPSVIMVSRVHRGPALGRTGLVSEETIMLTGNQPLPRLARTPWNKGRLIGQKRPLKPKDVWAIRVRLQLEQRKRDLALFNLAIDSKLRGCDLVRLHVSDVCVGGQIRDRATVIQRKTGRPVQFEITEQTRAAIGDWLANTGPASGQYLFPSRFHGQPHISTRQYARIVHRWVERAGLASSAYGTHSLRRTKAAQIYKKTGNLRAVQLLLGHTKLESTVRYLGIEVDDALSISEQVEL